MDGTISITNIGYDEDRNESNILYWEDPSKITLLTEFPFEHEQFGLAFLLPPFKTGHSGGVTGVEFAKGDDGGHVFASVSIDSGFRLWDRRQSYVCSSHRLGSPALSLSWEAISQALIAVGCQNGTVTILDKRALAVPVHMIQESHVGRVNAVRFSPANISSEGGSPLLASAGDDGTVTLQRVMGKEHEKRSALHSDYVKALAWRDESTLVTGGWDSQLCVMEIGQLDA